MKRMRQMVFFVMFVLLAGSQGWAKEPSFPEEEQPAKREATLILAGKLLVKAGEPVQERVSILVVGDHIEKIVPGFADPATIDGFDKIIRVDLRDSFVLPGLIDAHVHMLIPYFEDLSYYEKAARFTTFTEGQNALNGVCNARLTLDAGFTTVRDVGAQGSAIFALRDAINEGRIAGPRILAAGAALAVTGGHADDTGYNERLWRSGEIGGICDGVAECRRAVRSQIKRGADLIKITLTGGGGKPMGGPDAEPEFFRDEFVAAVETAHRLQKKVAVHAHGTKGIKLALESGVESVEHGTFLDDECISLFKKTGAYLVPTLSVADTFEGDFDKMPPYIQERVRYIAETKPKMMGKAHRSGVRFALGTDAGVVAHANGARELELLVDIGMTPEQAIEAGTVNAADLLGLADKIGALEPGMFADIIAVKGDPLTRISDIKDIGFVMKSGVVHLQR